MEGSEDRNAIVAQFDNLVARFRAGEPGPIEVSHLPWLDRSETNSYYHHLAEIIGEAGFLEIIATYLSMMGSELGSVRKAIEHGDRSKVRRCAHRISRGAIQICCTRVEYLFRGLERELLRDPSAPWSTLLPIAAQATVTFEQYLAHGPENTEPST